VTTPVPAQPSPLQLASFQVGRAVRAEHLVTLAGNLAFVSAHCVHNAVSCFLGGHRVVSTATLEFEVFYRRSPGVRVLRVSCVPMVVGLGFGEGKITIPGMALPSEADWLEDGDWDDTARAGTSVYSQTQTEWVAWVDVSDVLVGSISTIPITFTAGTISGTGAGAGIHTLTIAEMPNAFLAPELEASDPGVNSASLLPGNKLFDGSTTTSAGMVRLLEEVQRWRSQWPRTLQIVGSKTDTHELGSFTSTSWTALDAKFYTRAKRLGKGTTYKHKHTLCVLYKNDHATIGGKIRIKANGTALTSLALPATSGAWSAVYGTAGNQNLPVDGTDQVVELEVEAQVDSSGPTIKIATIALIDEV